MIAEIWANSLEHDSEFIEQLGFYQAGRTREPNMVKKGRKKNQFKMVGMGLLFPIVLLLANFMPRS